MALTTAMIGLATLAVRPVWTRHGCRFVRVLKNNHKERPPQFFPGDLGRTVRAADSEVHGLCLESFLRQHVLRRERRRAVGYLLLLLLLL